MDLADIAIETVNITENGDWTGAAERIIASDEPFVVLHMATFELQMRETDVVVAHGRARRLATAVQIQSNRRKAFESLAADI